MNGRVIAALVAILILFAVLDPLCSCRDRPRDVNERLVEVTDRALQMAQDAQEEAAASRRSLSGWYYASLVAAVAVPLGIAFLLFRLLAKTPPDAPEMLDELRRVSGEDQPKLPPSGKKMLTGPDRDESAHRDE